MYNCSCGNPCDHSGIAPYYDTDSCPGHHHHHHPHCCGCGCDCGCNCGCLPDVDAEVEELFECLNQMPRSWEVVQRCCRNRPWNPCGHHCGCWGIWGCGCGFGQGGYGCGDGV